MLWGMQWYWWLILIAVFIISIPLKIRFMRNLSKNKQKNKQKND